MLEILFFIFLVIVICIAIIVCCCLYIGAQSDRVTEQEIEESDLIKGGSHE